MTENVLLQAVKNINMYLSDYILVILLLAVGLFYSVKTRFVQVRCFKEGVKNIFAKQKSGGNVSSFQALATAVASQVGTGNIVGASGAILIGGPGAVFWMWVIAFFGMATIYAEAVLAQVTRVKNADGTFVGGPVYYIRKAYKGAFGKFLAGFFAVSATLSLGFMGSMVQSNSIGETCKNAFGIPSVAVGMAVSIIAGIIFIGGVKRLAGVMEKVVPVMAILYIIGGLVVLVARIKYIPQTFALIFKCAFVPQALLGGGFGTAFKLAVSQGAKRGLFSNEAGMGSTPHAHALADAQTPHQQGTLAIIGVFIDTFIVLTITALTVVSTLYTKGGILEKGMAAGVEKTNMAQLAFISIMGESAGGKFIALCLFFFAFSTIISWTFFGRVNAEYLFGKKAAVPYLTAGIISIILGSCLSNTLVWELMDLFNQLMVIPNVLVLFALSKTVTRESERVVLKSYSKK